jgi:predicted TIM-barrel fold metal-dependent hydrolase
MSLGTDFSIIDADAHVIESDLTWDFLEPAEAKYRPNLVPLKDDPSRGHWMVDGEASAAFIRKFTDLDIEKMSKVAGRNMATPAAAREMSDIPLRLRHLDQLGIDTQILYSTIWLTSLSRKPDAEAALAGAWNRWLIDIHKKSEGRLRWTCVLPMLLIDESIRQMRIAKENGAVGVFMRPYEGDRVMTDPYFDPIFAEAESLNLPITVHISNANVANAGFFMDAPIAQSTKGFTITRVPAVVGCMLLLLSDIAEKFPNLRWGFIESSAQWVPWVYNEAARRISATGKKVSPAIFKEKNIWIEAQDDDDLEFVLRYIDEDHLVTGTDYGHTDPSAKVDAIEVFLGRSDINDAIKKKVLHDNPKKLFAI